MITRLHYLNSNHGEKQTKPTWDMSKKKSRSRSESKKCKEPNEPVKQLEELTDLQRQIMVEEVNK